MPHSEDLNFTLSVARENVGDFLCGMLDIVVALSFGLVVGGAFTKEQIATFMDSIGEDVDRQAQRLGIEVDAPRQVARKAPAAIVAATLRMPMTGERRFTVVTGGKEGAPLGTPQPKP